MAPVFGIDFGTSNSALSVNQDGDVRLLDVDPENPISNSLKSILYFLKEDGEINTWIGHDGVRQYMDNGAEGRYMQSFKTFLPDAGFDRTTIYGKSHTLEDLIAIFLKTMKTRGEAHIGREVDHLVLGRPVRFSTDPEKDRLAETRLLAAARLAGFTHVQLQMEPVAAARSYEQQLAPGKEELVLVGDFGAGSSDFTVLRAGSRQHHQGDREQDILSVGGLYVGGDAFDAEIMRKKVAAYYGKNVVVKSMFSNNPTGLSPLVIRKLMHWHLIPQLRRPRTLGNIRELMVNASFADKKLLKNLETLILNNYGFLLFQAIEAAKCELSASDTTCIRFADSGMAIEEPVAQTEFQDMIRENVASIRQCIDQTLDDAGVSYPDIDAVFLTGGSAHIPLIRGLFESRMGKEKIRTGDAFTSVAYGLGLQALDRH